MSVLLSGLQVSYTVSDPMAECIVCGSYVDPGSHEAKETYKGRTYYFCCDKCREKFKENPEKYATKKATI